MYNDDDEYDAQEHKEKMDALYRDLPSNTNMKISCNAHFINSAEFARVADLLKHKNFSELDLSSNLLDAEAMPYLQQIIINNKNLTKIFLLYNKIDDAAISKLIDNSEVRDRLQHIDLELSCNPIKEAGLNTGLSCFSINTIASMTRGTFVKDQGLIDTIQSKISNHYSEEKKEAASTKPIGFFQLKDSKASTTTIPTPPQIKLK